MAQVDCTGLTAPTVLALMYNNAKPLERGVHQASCDKMTVSEAESLLENEIYFDYVKGRPLKTSFKNFPFLNPWGYDRDQGGDGTLQTLVNNCKKGCNVKPSIEHKGKLLSEFGKIAQYTQVWFVKSFVPELERRGIPYPEEWHVFMGTNQNGAYMFMGSMGGNFIVGNDEPVFDRISNDSML
jgi:hypothetical protein